MSVQHSVGPLSITELKEDGTFAGYASVFGVIDSHKEAVEPGAFKKSLARWTQKDNAPAMLWMHDPTMPIGVWYGMSEDKKGLVVYGKLALGTQKGHEAYELLKLKALTGLSIGYRVLSSKIDRRRKVRVLTDVDLFEVSLVTFPSNDKARVESVKAPDKKKKKRKKAVKKTSVTAASAQSKAKTKAVVARLEKAARKLTKKPATRRSK